MNWTELAELAMQNISHSSLVSSEEVAITLVVS